MYYLLYMTHYFDIVFCYHMKISFLSQAYWSINATWSCYKFSYKPFYTKKKKIYNPTKLIIDFKGKKTPAAFSTEQALASVRQISCTCNTNYGKRSRALALLNTPPVFAVRYCSVTISKSMSIHYEQNIWLLFS